MDTNQAVFMEADTVEHCGTSLMNDLYAKELSLIFNCFTPVLNSLIKCVLGLKSNGTKTYANPSPQVFHFQF